MMVPKKQQASKSKVIHSVEPDSSVTPSYTREPYGAQDGEEQETEVTAEKMTPQKGKEYKTKEMREQSENEEEM